MCHRGRPGPWSPRAGLCWVKKKEMCRDLNSSFHTPVPHLASQTYYNHDLCHVSPLSFAWPFTIIQILTTGMKPATLTDTEEEYLMVGHKWQCNRSGLNSKGSRKRGHIPSARAQEHPLQGKALLVPTAPAPFCLTVGHVTVAGVMEGAEFLINSISQWFP